MLILLTIVPLTGLAAVAFWASRLRGRLVLVDSNGVPIDSHA